MREACAIRFSKAREGVNLVRVSSCVCVCACQVMCVCLLFEFRAD